MITHQLKFKLSLVSLVVLSSTSTLATAKGQTEIEQLRQEVQALRAMIEQQQVQNVETSKAVTALATAPVVAAPAAVPKLKSGASINIYGNVRADASYQLKGGTASRSYNQISSVPLKGGDEGKEMFRSTLSATRLGMDVKHQLNGEEISGKIETDFLGGAGMDVLRIRHAYVNYGDWLLGQTWSNFAVPDYMPESIDALGFVGGAVKRTVQARYTQNFNPSTALVVAVEDPKDGSSNMRIPALTARLNHQFNEDGRVSLRLMGNEKRTQEDEEMAWGVGLGLQYKLTPSTTLKADYYHVKGDASFVSWANPGFSKNSDNEILDQNTFDSITVGVTQQLNEQWRGTLGYGYMKADLSDQYLSGLKGTEVNKNLWQAWGNIFYSPTKPLSLGLEYVYGERKAADVGLYGQDKGEDSRFNMVAIYNF